MPLSTRSILVGVANLLAIFLVIGAVGWYHENPSQFNTPVAVVSLPVATRGGAQSRRVLKGSKGKGSDCVPLGVNATEGKGKGKGSSKGKGYSAAPSYYCSEYPSMTPSDFPSQVPTPVPSVSGAPSDIPSQVPSIVKGKGGKGSEGGKGGKGSEGGKGKGGKGE